MSYYDLLGTAIVRLTHEKRCEECGASDVELVEGAAQVSGLYRMTYIGQDEPADPTLDDPCRRLRMT